MEIIQQFFTNMGFKAVGFMYVISFVALFYLGLRLYMYFINEQRNVRFQGTHAIFIYLITIFVCCYVYFADLNMLLLIPNIFLCLCLCIVSTVQMSLFGFLYYKNDATVNYIESTHPRHDHPAYH